MPETPGAKADSLTERANPALVLTTLEEIHFVLSLQAKGTELSIADIVFLTKLPLSFRSNIYTVLFLHIILD